MLPIRSRRKTYLRDPLLATLLIAKIKSSTVFASSEDTSTVRYGKVGQLHLERGQQGQCTYLLRLLRSPRSPRSRSLSLLRLRRLSRSGRSPRGIRSSRSRPSRSLHRSEETPAGVDSVPRGIPRRPSHSGNGFRAAPSHFSQYGGGNATTAPDLKWLTSYTTGDSNNNQGV